MNAPKANKPITKKKNSDNEWPLEHRVKLPDDPLLQCLIIITKIFHHPFSEQSLTGGLPLVDGRLTPELFLRAAERADLSAKLVDRPLDEIPLQALPAVLLMKDKQVCILEKVDRKGQAYVIQPDSGSGIKKIALSSLAKEYLGHAIFVRPAYHFDKRTEIPGTEQHKHWFWGTIKQAAPIYGEVIVASFFINLFALASPLFIMNVYDRVVPNNAIETLWVLAIGVGIVFSFDFVMRSLRGYFIDVASKNIDVRLSAMIFERILGVRMEVRPPSVGAMANTVHAFEAFRDFITSASISVLIDLPFTLIFIIVIWLIAGNLALVPLIAIPIVIGVGLLLQKPLTELVQESYRFAAQKQATLIEALIGVETLKSLAAESPIQRKWERVTCLAAGLGTKLRFLANFSTNFATFAQHFSSVAVIIFGVYKIAEGDITMGALIASTILTGRALAPMAQVAGLLTRYQQSVTSLHSVENLMAMPTERPIGETPLHHEHFAGDIEFRNVTFAYPEQPINALTDVSFKIKAGERVGFIGRMGSGKSTIEKLVMQLYQPTSGTILLDGIESHQLDPTDVRRHIGYVAQDVMLFYGSVKDNIVLSAPYVDDRTIIKAAKLAGVDEFLRGHPQGFELQVGERGTNLSGGQRQSIAMARGLLLDPPILIFDEPTSSMDDKTETQLKQRLTQTLEGKTLLLITHRGSMLSLVDRLIIVDGGTVLADGPKEKILQDLRDGNIHTKLQ